MGPSYGIRLNAIAPGDIPTEGASKRLNPGGEPSARTERANPMGRVGTHRGTAKSRDLSHRRRLRVADRRNHRAGRRTKPRHRLAISTSCAIGRTRNGRPRARPSRRKTKRIAPSARSDVDGLRSNAAGRHKREYPQRAAAAVADFQRRGDNQRAGRRQEIEIAQALQPIFAGAVHVVMTRVGRLEVRRLSRRRCRWFRCRSRARRARSPESARNLDRDRAYAVRCHRDFDRRRDPCASTSRCASSTHDPAAIRPCRLLPGREMVDGKNEIGVGARLRRCNRSRRPVR